MKNKKELLERIEILTEKEDLDNYILMTDKGCSILGSDPEILALISMLVDVAIKKCKNINKEMIEKAVRIGALTDEEKFAELKKSLEELKANISKEDK